MALTRAQLLSGNPTQGTVLSNQVQAFTAGVGLTVSGTGVLSIDTGPSFTAFVKTNNPLAYNSYVWPNSAGNPKQQLTTDGSGNLSWADPDSIPWTAKGQLVVGTGTNTDALLNPGADTAVLVANSASTTGLAYSDSLTSAIQLPAGLTGDQPLAPSVGMVRYNTSNNEFEGYGGSPASWQDLGGVPTGGGNDKIFYLNSQIVTTNYTIPTTPLAKNAMSSGPITIAAGVTVTVPAGSNWAIV
jgi:hypothetical protein